MVDEITPGAIPGLGLIEAKTSNFGGHPPEFWAEQLTNKICGYSDDSEPHVKEQARAYKDLIYRVCLIYLNNAIKSYKATLIQELLKSGEEEVAKIIKRIAREVDEFAYSERTKTIWDTNGNKIGTWEIKV